MISFKVNNNNLKKKKKSGIHVFSPIIQTQFERIHTENTLRK